MIAKFKLTKLFFQRAVHSSGTKMLMSTYIPVPINSIVEYLGLGTYFITYRYLIKSQKVLIVCLNGRSAGKDLFLKINLKCNVKKISMRKYQS